MSWIFLGLGLVLVIEGLAIALAPSRIEQVLAFLATLGPDRRRLIGLTAVAFGVVLVWIAQRLLA
jgi:uncharacterized protein YjeT (DUF2065 family)